MMGSICSQGEYTEESEMKKRALIYGAGDNFIHQFQSIAALYQISGVVDGSEEKKNKEIKGHTVFYADEAFIIDNSFDVVVVTPSDNGEIVQRLEGLGIAKEDIITISQIYDKAFCCNTMKIAVMFYGGMGDFLIGKNWLYHLAEKYKLKEEIWDVFLDSVAYERGKEVFETAEFIDEIKSIPSEYVSLMDKEREYDVIVRFCIFPFVQYFSGNAIAGRNKDFLDYILKLQRFGFENYCVGFCHNPNYFKTIRCLMEKFPEKKYHNYCDVFGELGIKEEFIFTLPIYGNEERFLKDYGLYNKPFITIDTGLNRDYKGGSSTRAWSHKNWNELALLLKVQFPELLTVQVGEKMSDGDDVAVDVNLNGRTNIDEARILMKHASVHVDYDGGLVHVRHILGGGPSVVLFGPTAVSRHTYSENIGIRTNACKNDCEWTTQRWLFDCPRGLEKPECMESITPESVCDEIKKLLIGVGM